MKKEEIKENRFSFKPSLSTIILAVVILVIALAFFFLLSQETGLPFGFLEVIFSIAIAILASLFLAWVRRMIKKNTYLGVIIGLGVLIAFEYGLYQKFQGPYSTTFSIVIAIIFLVFLGLGWRVLKVTLDYLLSFFVF